jgi:hypothetical protein
LFESPLQVHRSFVHITAAWLLCLGLLTTSPAFAQSVTGQISGTVIDAAGAIVGGVTVKLSSDLSKQERTLVTGASTGSFIFADLVPGNYSIQIVSPGFKTYTEHGINVSPNEKVALHDVRLQVGDVNSTVTVQAEVAHVATDSSDRGIAVNTNQIENTPVRGRDWLGTLQTLPGVVDLNNHDAPGWNSGTPTINGGQTGQLAISLDGILSQDSGSPGANGWMAPSPDAIGEGSGL